jgi:outer membrane protein OmpA-like peptidoglycan-associated protein
LRLAAAVAAATASSSASAGDVVLFKDTVPRAQEIADILFPEPGQAPQVQKTRGILFNDVPEAEGSPQAEQIQEAVAPDAAAVGFEIRFAFDSADIAPDALPYLDRVGQMMGLEQADGKTVVIVGHTDAAGTNAYNQALSERRALAVGQYLVDRHGVEPARLQVVGLGETQPLPGIASGDGANRRVEFHPGK